VDGRRHSLFQGVSSQQSAQTTAAGRMKCWIMRAGRQVRDSNVRLRSCETGLVATRGKGTCCCTTLVDISSAHQTQTRNVKTVRHDQRLHGPHPQHIQSLALLSAGHATPRAVHTLVSFSGKPRSIPDRPYGICNAGSGAGSPILPLSASTQRRSTLVLSFVTVAV
jgi:hypothetical protein